MTWLGIATTATFEQVLGKIDAGQTTEDDVVAEVTAAFLHQGVRLPVVLIAADGRIDRYRHPISAGRPIERRVMLVVCAERWGLIVAHTQFVELAPMTPEQLAAADATAHVLAAMRNATTPANTLGNVLTAAQDAYAETGMPDQWQLHHQGGSIGYRARERIATPKETTPIRPGMAFAWNPSVVGHKREETLYLDADGNPHIVTTTP
ncbi:MAG TPA: M24 family metallopeptidase [Aeromicrobium sp.]|nr:M24 family metallopeptidase [Aeromicrobium sp.]